MSAPTPDAIGAEIRAEIDRLRAELAGANETISHQCEAMSWIAGHDRAGLDHLDEAMRASEERDAAQLELSRILAAVDALIDHAKKVSPSDRMTVYVGDLEHALGRRSEPARTRTGSNE